MGMERPLAMIGDYQELRTTFFKWRALIRDKSIVPHGLNKLEIDLCSAMLYTNRWSTAQAHELYNIMQRHTSEMKRWGVDFSIVPRPTFIHKEPQRQQGTRVPTLYYDGEYLVLSFNFAQHLFDRVLQIPGRIYDREHKVHKFPISQSRLVMAFAEEFKFAVGESAKRVVFDYDTNFDQSYQVDRVELYLPVKKELFDYQTVGVDFGIRVKKVLNADQMGLGKTPQAIATSLGWNQWPILIVCPKHLRYNWKQEIEAWTHKKVLIGNHKNFKQLHRLVELNLVHFVIVNFDGLKTHFVQDIKTIETGDKKDFIHLNGLQNQFKGVIVDESHEFRNPKTMRYKIAKKVVDNYEYRQLLSGSPFVNNERDIAAQLDLLGVLDRFGGFASFVKKYSNMEKDFYSKKGQPDNLADLNAKLRSICMIRREKHQVAGQLPDKFRTNILVEIDNRKEYDLAYNDLHQWMNQNSFTDTVVEKRMKAELLTRIQVLKQLSARGKVSAFAEAARSIMDQGEKLVVFVWHIETINAIKEFFPMALEISGRVNDERVNANVKLFQEDPKHQMIIVTYKRGGTGLTLTAASTEAQLEQGWNPATQDQAEDRLHRWGQKSNVNILKFLGKNTIDIWIDELIERKRKFSKQSVGSTEVIETSVQHDLIDMIMKNPVKHEAIN
jgi:SWI/SNF-related matrix-associated actin-dependent regulator of chromatin subfamily A-like protein 1